MVGNFNYFTEAVVSKYNIELTGTSIVFISGNLLNLSTEISHFCHDIGGFVFTFHCGFKLNPQIVE